MKKTDFLKEIKGLPKADLLIRSRQIAEELMKLRFRGSSGQLEQGHRIGLLRRNLARIQTLLSAQVVKSEKPKNVEAASSAK